MDLSDLQRRLENLIRIGTIAHVDLSDTAAPRVRVQDGALLTAWLPFGSLRAGTARLWSAPTVGEQVVVLAPSGELGSAVVFGSLFCSNTPAPSSAANMHILDFADGTRWTHDDKASASVFEGMRTVLIDAKDSITLRAPQTLVASNISTTGTLTNNGKNVGSTHQHSGIVPGPANTGTPT